MSSDLDFLDIALGVAIGLGIAHDDGFIGNNSNAQAEPTPVVEQVQQDQQQKPAIPVIVPKP
ncbi:MAG: hypothetical protein H6867_02810 [Rhodospirillales bacterium]|nr:hypothetical protein [Rhodospirillales bacterium]MCB9997120.1 hypothetical protein [Rhodospirillales bacterium]